MATGEQFVWIFVGEAARFPAGVFSTRDLAAQWIREHKLSGVLTAYPLDRGAYEWAIEHLWFTPRSEKHSSAQFIQSFTSAHQEHEHFEHGEAL